MSQPSHSGARPAAVLVGFLALSAIGVAHGQSTNPPPQSPQGSQSQQTETDIGKVSTGAGQGAEEQVVPSSTTTRAAAIEAKRQAPNIVEIQPLSEMEKLPDVNLAEALQRVPGISLETDSGEGRFIVIRGMDSDLNGTSYAGVRLPATNPSSPFGGGRAVAFDTFPTGIVGGVEVTKTLRPDMDAEGLGGTINLVPRTGAEHGGQPFVDANLGLGYEPLRDSPAYHAEVSAGRTFFDGNLTAVITGVYHQDSRGIDDVEESYSDNQAIGVPDKTLNSLEYRWYEYTRKRYGAAGNFELKASDSTTLYLRLLWSGYLETAKKHYLVFNNLDGCVNAGNTPDPGCVIDPGNSAAFLAPTANPSQQTTDSKERIENDLAIIGGSTTFSKLKVDYRASYAVGLDRVSTSYGSVWTDFVLPFQAGTPSNGQTPVNVPMVYNNNSDPRYPTYQTLNGMNPANPANYQLQEIDLGPSDARDSESNFAIDFTIPTGSGTHTADWKFGLQARIRHKTSTATSPVFTTNNVISLAPYTFGPPQIYYNNHYNIGPMINLDQVAQLANSNQGTISDDAAADASGNQAAYENVYAGYGEYEGRWGPWGLLAGARVESTHAKYLGNVYNSDNDTNTPAEEKNNYTNVFPTVQGRYFFSDELIARLTYASGIARPGFNQITPGASISVSGATVSVGNPTLKPTIGQNFDATLEWYPGEGQIAALGLFAKDFSNYILLSQTIVPGYPFPGLEGVTTTVQSFSNGPAHAYGGEAQYEQRFVFLPRPWDGFGINANVTVVSSRAQLHPAVPGQAAQFGLMPSTSQLTWNAALYYETNRIEVRLAADYVGQNLFSFGSNTATDTFSSARLTMDLGATYRVTHYAQVYFEAKNLLNTPLEFTEGPSFFRPIQREFYDSTYFLGARLSF
jgi:TonB-dependent receptor